MLKVFVLCTLMVALAWAQKPSEEQIMAAVGDCMKKLNLDMDLSNAKAEDMDAALNDPKFKCLPKCVYEGLGFVENGVVLREKMIKSAEPYGPEIMNIVKKCMEITDPDPCEESRKMIICKKELHSMKP